MSRRCAPASRRCVKRSSGCWNRTALRRASSPRRQPNSLQDTGAVPSLDGQRIGPYLVAARIGAGGMGEVYKARDTRLDRTVAIKVLPWHCGR